MRYEDYEIRYKCGDSNFRLDNVIHIDFKAINSSSESEIAVWTVTDDGEVEVIIDYISSFIIKKK